MERVPIELLKEVLAAAERALPVGSRYKHYKRGEEFVITGFSIDELTNDVRIQYARPGDASAFARPVVEFSRLVNEWQEPVKTEHYEGHRFTRVQTDYEKAAEARS